MNILIINCSPEETAQPLKLQIQSVDIYRTVIQSKQFVLMTLTSNIAEAAENATPRQNVFNMMIRKKLSHIMNGRIRLYLFLRHIGQTFPGSSRYLLTDAPLGAIHMNRMQKYPKVKKVIQSH